MLDFSLLAEFSRHHCVAICAFLIPANLLVTLYTLVSIALDRPQAYIRWSVAIATVLASTLYLHVGTWLAIGVVRNVTFILVGLATTCLAVNFWAIAYRQTFRRLLQAYLPNRLA